MEVIKIREMDKYNILIIDDNRYILEFFRILFENESEYELFAFSDPIAAYDLVLKVGFHIIFLDFYMHPINGGDLCNMIRNSPLNNFAYIICITGEHNKEKQLSIFQSAPFDKFLVKGVDDGLMIAERVKAIIRREKKNYVKNEPHILLKKDFKYYLGEREIPLTHTEFEILRVLASNHQDFYTSAMISELLNKKLPGEITNSSTIRVHIKSIRDKLQNIDPVSEFIITIPRKGYVLANLSCSINF